MPQPPGNDYRCIELASARLLPLAGSCSGCSARFGYRNSAGTMSTNRIFTIVMPGKIIA